MQEKITAATSKELEAKEELGRGEPFDVLPLQAQRPRQL
jgi:hypothetical protein